MDSIRKPPAAGPDASRPIETLVSAPRGLTDSRMVLMAGVAGACLLGAAAGAWVGPRDEDLKAREVVRQTARSPQARAPDPQMQMQIVMDASALPSRPPMQVLPDRTPPAAEPFVARAPPEATALRLVQDEAPAATTPNAEKAKPAKVEIARAETRPAKPKATEAGKARKAKAETKLAKAEARRKAKAEKVEFAKAKGANAKPNKIVLAKAEPKKAEKARPKADKPVVLARTGPRPAPKVEKPKAALPKAPEKPALALAETKPMPKPERPVNVAKVTAKAPRPALQPRQAENAWADEDLRLARAYRRAAEAGVPEWRLERQQARWRQAREAAERDAPWAVRRIYAARIAELDDLAGEAAMEWN